MQRWDGRCARQAAAAAAATLGFLRGAAGALCAVKKALFCLARFTGSQLGGRAPSASLREQLPPARHALTGDPLGLLLAHCWCLAEQARQELVHAEHRREAEQEGQQEPGSHRGGCSCSWDQRKCAGERKRRYLPTRVLCAAGHIVEMLLYFNLPSVRSSGVPHQLCRVAGCSMHALLVPGRASRRGSDGGSLGRQGRRRPHRRSAPGTAAAALPAPPSRGTAESSPSQPGADPEAATATLPSGCRWPQLAVDGRRKCGSMQRGSRTASTSSRTSTCELKHLGHP